MSNEKKEMKEREWGKWKVRLQMRTMTENTRIEEKWKNFQKVLKEKWEEVWNCFSQLRLEVGTHLAGLCSETWAVCVWVGDGGLQSDRGQVRWPHPTLGCDYHVTQTGSDQIRVDSLTWCQISLLQISLLKHVLWQLHMKANYTLGTPVCLDVIFVMMKTLHYKLMI